MEEIILKYKVINIKEITEEILEKINREKSYIYCSFPQIYYRGIDQKEFAFILNMQEKGINKLINGEVQLTPETAIKVELVPGFLPVSGITWKPFIEKN